MNTLIHKYPDLAKEWVVDKNEQDLSTITFGSHSVVWWKCPKGHEYKAEIKARCRGNGCPYCRNKKINNKNSLAVLNPILAKEWHPTNNFPLMPDSVPVSGRKKVWWLCSKCNGEWQKTIDRRNYGRGCPYCANKRANSINSLEANFPNIAKEWHPIKNADLKPRDCVLYSGKKVWWQCSKGHEWKTSISDRTYKGYCCPICSKIELTDGSYFASMPEAYFYLKLRGRNIKCQYDKKYGHGQRRFDFYIPEENTYIEVTGFTKNTVKNMPGFWFKYLRNIVVKRRYVENVLKAKFRFIQLNLNPKQRQRVQQEII